MYTKWLNIREAQREAICHCFSSVLILHMFLSLARRKEQSRTERHEGGVVTDKRMVDFILTDIGIICEDKKLEPNDEHKSHETPNSTNTLRYISTA